MIIYLTFIDIKAQGDLLLIHQSLSLYNTECLSQCSYIPRNKKLNSRPWVILIKIGYNSGYMLGAWQYGFKVKLDY